MGESRMDQQLEEVAEATGGVVGAIPARYASSRLPGKPLLPIAGRPMIQHVYERASRVDEFERVVVLTDDSRIEAAVLAFGGDCLMTPATCGSGTDRIAWASEQWNARAVVNIQGDEPLIDPAVVSRVAKHLLANPEDPMVTLACEARAEEFANPNAVKVVLDRKGYALYFSRSRIPYPRNEPALSPLRHVGLYGYQIKALQRLASLEPTPLELAESLEQLRALENGIAIRVLLTDGASPGVDTVDDLQRVEQQMLSSS